MASTIPKKDFHIAVVGGGIAGVALVIGLVRKGIDVTLFEATEKFSEIGAGIAFSPNAVRCMELIDPSIKEHYMTIETSNAWPSKKMVWFTQQHGQGVGEGERKIISEPRSDVLGVSTCHRAHFLDQMVSLLPEGITRFNKRILKTEDLGEDGVVLHFEDGTSATADALIGCDGVRSRVRIDVLGPDDPEAYPRFADKYAYRALVPMEKAIAALGEECARNSQMYFGHHGHIVTFPIEKGTTMNIIAFRNKTDGVWENDRWIVESSREALEEHYKDFSPHVRKLIGLIEKMEIWAMFDSPFVRTYTNGSRIVLLGDAAHATTPHHGAGAGMCLEDAYVMAEVLGEVTDASQLTAAFHAYDAIRRPRSQKLVQESRASGRLYEFEDPECGSDTEKLRNKLLTRNNWIWDIDLLAEAKRTIDMFHDEWAKGMKTPARTTTTSEIATNTMVTA
jgi:salicylate hydroxylase